MRKYNLAKKTKIIKNSIVVIPFSVPWNWTTDYNNQTVKILSKNNLIICLFNSNPLSIKELIVNKKGFKLFFKINTNVIGFNYLQLIPFKRFSFIRTINEYLCSFILLGYVFFISLFREFKGHYMWFFDTYWYKSFRLFKYFFYTIYDCVDYHLDMTFIPRSMQKDRKKEEFTMVKQVNLFTVNSIQLFNIYKKIRADLILVPRGFRTESFIKYRLKQKFKVKRRLDKKVIGYVGGVNNRLDYDLIIKLVSKHPEYEFVFVGQIQLLTEENKRKKDILFSYKNVRFDGVKSKSEIPEIIGSFDIAIIPYDINQEFNRYCYPMKIFEYFYLGKPVISTEIEELKRFPDFVKIGKNMQEWEKHLIYFSLNRMSPKKQNEMMQIALENSWENKVSLICQSIIKDHQK